MTERFSFISEFKHLFLQPPRSSHANVSKFEPRDYQPNAAFSSLLRLLRGATLYSNNWINFECSIAFQWTKKYVLNGLLIQLSVCVFFFLPVVCCWFATCVNSLVETRDAEMFIRTRCCHYCATFFVPVSSKSTKKMKYFARRLTAAMIRYSFFCQYGKHFVCVLCLAVSFECRLYGFHSRSRVQHCFVWITILFSYSRLLCTLFCLFFPSIKYGRKLEALSMIW